MKEAAESPHLVGFDSFEVDLWSRELHKNGERIKLPEQSFQILAMLLERPGEVVSRQQIQNRLWPNDTVVEFENSINAAIKKLRAALGDSADQPRYVGTLARRGYCWKVPVERIELAPMKRAAPDTAAAALQTNSSTPRVIGEKVTHYRILEVLGGGGMGVVYKAEDLKLGRRVALKFLPTELGKDARALERFEHEARAASALDHPNICSIYEFGEHEGQPFIVMPLLEGQTLRDRIAASPAAFAINEFLDLALQVCAGLEAAHEKGIIHRDIKPANVFVTNRSEAKILDFGLAKLTCAGDLETNWRLEASPGVARDLALTRTGMALGTAAYMSPEQVRGEKLDTRSDLFSFGLVLFEMATGRHAFSQETASAIGAAILQQIPVPARQLNPNVPSKLEEIINRALEKDVTLRYQHAYEIRTDLEQLEREMGPGRSMLEEQQITVKTTWSNHTKDMPLAAFTSKRKVGVMAFTVLVFGMLIVVELGIYSFSHARRTARFSEFNITQVTNSGNVRIAAISPDGSYVLSVLDDYGMESLWLRNVPTNSDIQIIPPAPVYYESLIFSPDGNYIYFRKAGNATHTEFDLYRAPVLGGRPQIVVRNVDTNISFSPDARRIVYARGQDPDNDKYRLLSVNVDGSEEQVLQSGPFLKMPSSPAWSPNGKEIVYDIFQPDSRTLGGLDLLELAGGTNRALARFDDKSVNEIKWLPDGHGLIAVYQDGLYRAQIGYIEYPRMILRRITRDTNSYVTLTLSSDGKTLVTVQRKILQTLSITAGLGKHEGNPNLVPVAPIILGPSPVAYMGFDWVGNAALLFSDPTGVSRIATDSKNRTTTLAEPGILDVASCGARYLLLTWAYHQRSNAINIWRTNADGSDPIQLTKGKQDQVPICSRDLKWVYYFNGEAQELRRTPLSGGKSQPLTNMLIPDGAVIGQFGLSPDGTLLAYPVMVGETGTNQKIVLVNLTSDTAAESQILDADQRISGGVRFTPDGRALAYPVRDKGADNIWVQPLGGSSPGRKITDFKSEQIVDFHWSPDGKVLGVLRSHPDSDVILIREKD